MHRNWTEHELLIAMNLYCRLSFGKFDQSNKHIREVAGKMGRTPGALAMKLSNLASLDTLHQSRGVVGLNQTSKLDRKVWSEFQNNWSVMAERSEKAFESLMADNSVPETGIENNMPSGPSETERNIKTRRLQQFFRRVVLSSYDNRCALTGIAVPQLLVASHIIPWSENEHRRADPTNGLCLNALHDKGFDRHLITFDEDLRLVVSNVLKKGEVADLQSANFKKLEGATLRLPNRFSPDPIALEAHRKAFVA